MSVSPAGWLNGFDPSNAGTIASSLQSLLGGAINDPANRTTPAGFNVLAPGPAPKPAPPSQFQQALNAFTVSADTYLIQSAIAGYQPLAVPATTLGSTAAYYAGLNETAQQILAAGKSGNYGSLNALA